MDARLNEEKVMDERLKDMPFVHADYGRLPNYAIMRAGRKYKSIPLIKGFITHMKRLAETLNADTEKTKNNEQIYGAADIYKDVEEYLKGCSIRKNSIIGRELLLAASPQWFKGMTKQNFELWKDTNLGWLKQVFGDNLRAAYLHMDETSPHIHALIVPKLWNEKYKKHTLQHHKYFDGLDKLRGLQDSYADHMQRVFPSLTRGIKGSKRHHIDIKKFYSIMERNSKETNMETLQAKAAHEEMLLMKVNYMDKTLKSFQHYGAQKDEENKKLQEEVKKLERELAELKKNFGVNQDQKQDKKQEQKKTIRRFSGRKI